jgi:repressor LexA
LRQQVDQGRMPHTHSTEQQVDAKTIPLLGLVAAGNPIEAIENYDQTISIPSSMVKSGKQYFALTVQGDSMIEDGILEDDVIICEHAPKARTGQTVVAVIDGEATVKKFHQHDEKNNIIELHPANSRLSPILVTPEQDFKFAGIVVGLFRNLY